MKIATKILILVFVLAQLTLSAESSLTFKSAVRNVCTKKLAYLKSPTKENQAKLEKNQKALKNLFQDKTDKEIMSKKAEINICKEVREYKNKGKSETPNKKPKKKLNKKTTPVTAYQKAVNTMCQAKVDLLQEANKSNQKSFNEKQKIVNNKFPHKKNKDLVQAKAQSKECAKVQELKALDTEVTKRKKRSYVSQDIKNNKAADRTDVLNQQKSSPLDMYLNFGFGPQVSWMGSPIDHKGLTGFGFDVFYVIPSKSLKKHHKSLPTFMKKTQNVQEDYEYYPLGVLAFLPTKVTVSPSFGGSTAAYGLNFGALGYYKTFAPQSKFSLKSGIKFPVLDYTYIDSDLIQGGPMHFLGAGAGVELKGIFKINKLWNISLEWHGQGYLPLSTTEVKNLQGETEKLWYRNTLGLLFHYKIPWIKRL